MNCGSRKLDSSRCSDIRARRPYTPEKGKKMPTLYNIPIERIHPHPMNPRKSMGDLQELIDSVKANGILQNLSVVQNEDGQGFTVVIGHRRLAAAAAAGLHTVPCAIVEMDEAAQIRTMLMENIQRNDLTMSEQAQGFQMMLDLGESIEDIARASGFSEATVRRRVKLMVLDAEKLKKAEERGATLAEYMELDKIKSVDRKNKVLDAVGTNNFRNELRRALEDEEQEEFMDSVVEKLSAFATEIDEDTEAVPMKWEKTYSKWDTKAEVEVPEDAGKARYFFSREGYGIRVYKEETEEEKQADAQAKAAEKLRRDDEQAKRELLAGITERHHKLRKDFVAKYGAAKQHIPEISFFAVRAVVHGLNSCDDVDIELLAELLGIEVDENSTQEELEEDVADAAEARPEYALLAVAYSVMDAGRRGVPGYWSSEWTNKGSLYYHAENEKLDRLYRFLCALGYEMSDEERAMQEGTHWVFTGGVEEVTVEDEPEEGEAE